MRCEMIVVPAGGDVRVVSVACMWLFVSEEGRDAPREVLVRGLC